VQQHPGRAPLAAAGFPSRVLDACPPPYTHTPGCWACDQLPALHIPCVRAPLAVAVQEVFDETVQAWVAAALQLVELLPTHPATAPIFRDIDDASSSSSSKDSSGGSSSSSSSSSSSGSSSGSSTGGGGSSSQQQQQGSDASVTRLPEMGDGPSAGVDSSSDAGAGAGASASAVQQQRQQQAQAGDGAVQLIHSDAGAGAGQGDAAPLHLVHSSRAAGGGAGSSWPRLDRAFPLLVAVGGLAVLVLVLTRWAAAGQPRRPGLGGAGEPGGGGGELWWAWGVPCLSDSPPVCPCAGAAMPTSPSCRSAPPSPGRSWPLHAAAARG
jgi:hypothetical protein